LDPDDFFRVGGTRRVHGFLQGFAEPAGDDFYLVIAAEQAYRLSPGYWHPFS